MERTSNLESVDRIATQELVGVWIKNMVQPTKLTGDARPASSIGGGQQGDNTASSTKLPPAESLAGNHFDGIICFGGEDWWYHNRGHFDIQMMRQLSEQYPVLYVNSIGVRMPSAREGNIFLRRIAQKLRSYARGLTHIRPNFSVFTPVTVPLLHRRTFGRRWLAAQVRHAARRLGMRRPLVWVAVPTAVRVLDLIPRSAMVYQRTDRFEEFGGVDRDYIRSLDLTAKSMADLTLFSSGVLYDSEKSQAANAAYLDHGVDYERFLAAAKHPRPPSDLRSIPWPRVGFIGGIDAHTFDPALFNQVAEDLTHVSFVLVGAVSLPADWCRLANVYQLGRRPYEQVAHYMAACDVLIMPWAQNEWIKACNPVKLKEYLAAGRPVVTTYFPEIDRYRNVVRVAHASAEFASAIRDAIRDGADTRALQAAVGEHTWEAKAQRVIDILTQKLRKT